MRKFSKRMAATLLALASVAVVAAAPAVSWAQAPGMDPQAVKLLERMTSYLAGLKAFSVDTQNTMEEILDSGQKVQFDASASVLVQRPNKLRAARKGDIVNQVLYYDGKTLTLYSPADKYYATAPAPGTIEETLDFARESLGLVMPASDLLYRNAFPLLMRVVTAGTVVGKAVIDGVKCDHLAFIGSAADLQVWIPDAGQPLPRKYVVTDKSVSAQPEYVARLSNWNVAPKVSDATFTFVPPPGVKKTEFLKLSTGSASTR